MATIKKATKVPNGPLIKKDGTSLKKGGKVMLKRADGSYSQRGLWDNIRANKGSGKKPTAEMLKQERKIKKAQDGYVTKDKKGVITNLQKLQTKSGPRYYQSSGSDWSITDKMNASKARTESKDSIPSSKLNKKQLETLNQKKIGGKIKKARTGAWQRKEGKNPSGGLNAKGVASYRAENPGSKLKMAVTTPPSKLKPGSKAAKRRKSFCARMSGVSGPMKKPNGKPTRKALALRKWNC